METAHIIARKIKAYMDSKNYLDSSGRIPATNNAYSWDVMDVNADPKLVKLIKLPRGYLLGGVKAKVFEDKPEYCMSDFFEVHAGLDFKFSIARTIADQYSLNLDVEKDTAKVFGVDRHVPFRFTASLTTPQRSGVTVAKRSIDNLVEAVRKLDGVLHDPQLKAKVDQYLKDHSVFRNQHARKLVYF